MVPMRGYRLVETPPLDGPPGFGVRQSPGALEQATRWTVKRASRGPPPPGAGPRYLPPSLLNEVHPALWRSAD